MTDVIKILASFFRAIHLRYSSVYMLDLASVGPSVDNKISATKRRIDLGISLDGNLWSVGVPKRLFQGRVL